MKIIAIDVCDPLVSNHWFDMCGPELFIEEDCVRFALVNMLLIEPFPELICDSSFMSRQFLA